MKRCPSCNRTYTDDRMTNCGHDGAPLMSTAYSAPYNTAQAPPAHMPQGYPPPPPPGYGAQGAPWQNHPPPPGYPAQNYPPLTGGWPTGLSEYLPCPRCTRPDPEQIKFTWWGGVIGPRLFKHVKCNGCGLTYNGKSGQSNTTNIVVYSVVIGAIFFIITLLIVMR
jgi:transposase-like protein